MQRRRRVRLAAGLAIFLFTFGFTAASGKSSASAPLAVERLHGSFLTLETAASFDWAHLRVAGPNEANIEREFSAGERLSLEVTGEQGNPLPDGLYTYRLRVTLADGESAGHRGVFYIESGRLVPRQQKQDELARLREDIARSRQEDPFRRAISFDDSVTIVDDDDDGSTFVSMLANDGIGSFNSHWFLQNDHNRFETIFYDPDINNAFYTVFTINRFISGDFYATLGSDQDYTGSLNVVGDSSPEIFLRDSDDQVEVELELRGTGDLDVKLEPGAQLIVSGDFSTASSRELKEGFVEVASSEILAAVADLPIQRWNYKGNRNTQHIGPVAEDFHELFGLGADDRHISPTDTGGVALAAIQALNEALAGREAELAELRLEVAALTLWREQTTGPPHRRAGTGTAFH